MFKYLRETRGEMKHVSWPSRRQVIMFTILVILVSILVSIFLGLFDGLFTRGLQYFIHGN